MATKKYEGKKNIEGKSYNINDSLTVEEALQLNINNKAFTVSMRTPGNDESLVRGLLHSENIINDPKFMPKYTVIEGRTDAQTEINVDIPEDKLGSGYSNSRSLLSLSSCGICGKTELKDIEFSGEKLNENKKIETNLIHRLFGKMQTKQRDFKESGGTHAAAAFTLTGDLLCSMEDIGRHNAVDKVIGNLIIFNTLDKAKILTVSGRISYEIVVKCFKAGIPFLAAVSAPSSLAVDYAKELGITLFAFCRTNRATCYSNPQWIK